MHKTVDTDLKFRNSKLMGNCIPDSHVDLKTSKYLDIKDVLQKQYERAEVPKDRLYMIDKVVRMRA